MAKITDIKKLLEIRRLVKKRKPTYLRQQTNQYKKFKNDLKWRRPKGYQSKSRLNHRAHIGMLKIGYKSPKLVRGFNKQGLEEIRVNNLKDLKNTKLEENQVYLLAGKIGGKKRVTIYQYAKENKITFSNIRDMEKELIELEKKGGSKKWI